MSSKYWFHKAICSKIMARAYENIGLIAEADYYRREVIFFIAKGLEALAQSAAI